MQTATEYRIDGVKVDPNVYKMHKKEPEGTKAVFAYPGQQQQFLLTEADIALYGGQAGSAKSWALLMLPIRHCQINPNFSCVIFRRTHPQITSPGGLWDQSAELYRQERASPKQDTLTWVFPKGGKVKFAHMQHEKDRHEWDGSQIPLICFDQLEHFTDKQFFYMLARNRSTCGTKPYVRATANPTPDGWLRELVRWWVDDETGLPIRERSGVLRWFVRRENEMIWSGSRTELIERYGEDSLPTSFTFIHGDIYENEVLLQRNPSYLANLKALPKVDRERLLLGNWNARESAGMFFQREWYEIVEAAPMLVDEVRYWDRAGTEESVATPEHSHTAGVRMGKDKNGTIYVVDVSRFQGSPMTVQERIKNVASQDSVKVRVGIEQDPGQAGKAEAQLVARLLAGYNVTINPVREAKGIRARPLSAQVEAGNVKLVRGAWNDAYIRECENFDGSKDCISDQVDASSGAFHLLTAKKRAGTWGKR